MTCRFYSSAVTTGLRKRHIVNRIIDSNDFDCRYSHQFNLVPCDNTNKYYLIDLTFNQFMNGEFPNLIEDGYMLVDDETFKKYLEIRI